MKLTQEVIDEVRSKASISRVIGHYIPLVRKGRSFSAVCPFHDDHDPSLSISEDKQIYKCFVCGNGGNVFTFVMNFKHLSFPEAVKEVAEIEGMHLDIEIAEKPVKVSPYRRLYDLLDESVSFCHYLINAQDSKAARDYLEKRDLNTDIVDKFNIGYNPPGDYLCRYLSSKGYKDEEILNANVGRLYGERMVDVFADRILFPIADKEGRTVGFTARDISGHSDAKYINTGETKIYTKGDILYNYHRAKAPAKEAGRVVVCEGVMDAIAFERAGISYVTATLGTSFTKNQLALLKELSLSLVLAYDGDEAGQKAIMKLGEAALKEGFNVTVMDNKTGLDPDEIILTYEEKALRDLVSHSISFIDFAMQYYQHHLNLQNYSDRKEMTVKVTELIALLKDEYDRINYEDSLFRITQLRKIETNKPKKEYNEKKMSAPIYTVDGLTLAEYTILVLIASSKRGLEIYKQELGSLLHDPCQKLAVMISEDTRKNGSCSFARIYDECTDKTLRNLIEDLSTLPLLPKEYDEKLLKGALEKLKNEYRLRRMNQIQDKIKRLQNVDAQRVDELLREYAQLAKEIGGSYDK